MELVYLFQQLPDLVVSRDQDRVIQLVNPAFVAAFGGSAKAWVGQHLDGAVSGAQIGAFDENRAYGHIEIDGQLHWVEWIETPLSEGGSLAVGRLNLDRRQKQRSDNLGRNCRRKNAAEPYQEQLPTEPSLTKPLNVAAQSMARPEMSTQVPAPRFAPAAQTATRVLLAEDDLLNAKLACALLERSGCVVTHVENGAEAVLMAKNQEYDLVFMDVRMPQMDGLRATRAIRELGGKWTDIPIVALTANAFAEDKDACHKAGMNGFLTKPFSIDALEAAQKRWTGGENHAKTA